MWGVTRSIKFQNKLAKEAIINALKSRSKDMFQDGDMIIRAFINVTENSIEIFHHQREITHDSIQFTYHSLEITHD